MEKLLTLPLPKEDDSQQNMQRTKEGIFHGLLLLLLPLPIDHLLKAHGTRLLPTKNPNFNLKTECRVLLLEGNRQWSLQNLFLSSTSITSTSINRLNLIRVKIHNQRFSSHLQPINNITAHFSALLDLHLHKIWAAPSKSLQPAI
ncbi:hypothetical protein V2J09_021851 [Rumex salicifolius]